MTDLCLMTVHAHPDDESSKGAGTVARCHEEKIRTVLVCCTGGEAGDILNPEMDRPEIRENLAVVRRGELEAAAAIIGYDEVVMLGYKDSGMPGMPENEDPACFARADPEEALSRLVAEIRRHRPQVIVTYDEEQSGYPHPDHIRVHEISVAAFDAAGDPTRFADLGDAWTPLKLYYTVWSRRRVVAMHEKFIELGLESPFDNRWFERPSRDEVITTNVDVSDYYPVRTAALRAHRTQIETGSKFWFGLPDEVARTVHPFDDYCLARHRLDREPELPETDLFSGIR